MMDAIQLLVKQHDQVDELVKAIESADDAKSKAAYFAEFADKLLAHASIEETLFYPAVLNDQTSAMILEAAEEHLSLRRLLSDMVAMKVNDPEFDPKLKVLKEQMEHHNHEEEEKKLFPLVRKGLSAVALGEIGTEMAREFDRLLKKQPRESVHKETAHAIAII